MSAAARSTSQGLFALGGAALLLAVYVAYIPALSGGFVWDDNLQISDNYLLFSLDGLKTIWTQPQASTGGTYWPLSWSLFWIENKLWDIAPLGYHIVSVTTHALNAVLLWLLLRRLRVPGAWLGASLFALHPIQVDSVAWIIEQKNTLSLFLGLSSALLYFNKEQRHAYALSIILFGAAMLSKSTIAVLAPILLIVHLWMDGRLRLQRIKRAGPFFLLGLAVGVFQVITLAHTKPVDAVTSLHTLVTLWSTCAIQSLGKIFWPYPLMAVYPTLNPSALAHLPSLAILLALLGFMFALKKRIGPGCLLALLGFLIAYLPQLQYLRDPYARSFTSITDHMCYAASIPVLAFVGATIEMLCRRCGRRAYTARAVPCLLLLLLGGMTWNHAALYESDKTLFEHTLEHNPDAWLAHMNLGDALLAEGDVERATFHFQRTLEIDPDNAGGHIGLGIGFAMRNEYDDAFRHFETALELQPDSIDARKNYGLALYNAGRFERAEKILRQGLAVSPYNADVHFQLGVVLTLLERWQEAIESFKTAIRYYPYHTGAHHNLGVLFYGAKQFPQALSMYEKAIELEPDNALAHLGRAQVLIEMGRTDEASQALARARSLATARPDLADRIRGLERILDAPR